VQLIVYHLTGSLQATSLINITFELSRAPDTVHQGTLDILLTGLQTNSTNRHMDGKWEVRDLYLATVSISKDAQWGFYRGFNL
jgi:hypothetical protein